MPVVHEIASANTELFQAIVEQASEAIIFADREGAIRVWNRGAETVFGYRAAEVLGQSVDIIIPERLRGAHWEGFRKAIDTGQTKYTDRVLTTRSVHKDGSKLYVSLKLRPGQKRGGSRGRFYEEVGVIRDVVQNHLLQVIALLAMDAPAGRDPESTRREKLRLFRAMWPLDPAQVVRGQFRGYRAEAGVAPDSPVETFAAMCLHIDTWRWAGVPFYIRAGKRLPITAAEAVVAGEEGWHDPAVEKSPPC